MVTKQLLDPESVNPLPSFPLYAALASRYTTLVAVGVQHWLLPQQQLHGTMAWIRKASRCFRPSLVLLCRRGKARLHGPLFFLTS